MTEYKLLAKEILSSIRKYEDNLVILDEETALAVLRLVNKLEDETSISISEDDYLTLQDLVTNITVIFVDRKKKK